MLSSSGSWATKYVVFRVAWIQCLKKDLQKNKPLTISQIWDFVLNSWWCGKGLN